MKKILLIVFVFTSLQSFGGDTTVVKTGIDFEFYYKYRFSPPANVLYYTNIAARYKWIAGIFDSTLTAPSGTTAQIRVRGNQAQGAIFYDSTGADSGLHVLGSGQVWQRLARAGELTTLTLPVSSLRAATANNTIDNTNFIQQWQWPTLAGAGFNISATSTAGTNGGHLVSISRSGANATSTITTKALKVSNGHTGTASTNIGIEASATTGTNNYAIIVPDGGGSVGIGTSVPVASSMLELSSTTKGFLAPRMTEAQRDAIGTPATGLLIYQTDGTAGFYYYSGSAWTVIGGGGGITSFTDGGGFDGTVTGSALSLISTVTNDQYVYSNSGALTGSTLLTRDGTNSAILINSVTVPDASFDLGITGSFLAGVTQRFIVVPEGAALGNIPAGARMTSNSGVNFIVAAGMGQGSITTERVVFGNYTGAAFNRVISYGNGVVASLLLVEDGGEVLAGGSTDNGAFTLQNNGAFYTQTVNVAVITATDGDATIAATTGFEILPTISANRNVTFPAQSAGKTITVWNKNSAGFAWNIVGTVIDAADNAITALVNDTMYTFISDGTSWVKKN